MPGRSDTPFLRSRFRFAHPDADVTLDLGEAFNLTYDRGRFSGFFATARPCRIIFPWTRPTTSGQKVSCAEWEVGSRQ